MENEKTEEQKELELLKELAEKHNYLMVKNISKDFCEEQNGFKILSYHTIEDINNVLEGEPLYVEYDFSDEKKEYIEFDNGKALSYLLLNDIMFLNTHWYKKDWSEEAKNTTSLVVNCNDVFAWGCADAEEVTLKDLKDLYYHVKKDKNYGSIVWCIKKRNMLPQKPVYDIIQNDGVWNLDEMNLEKNDW